MNIQGGNGQRNLACTCANVHAGGHAFEGFVTALSGFPHFSPPTDAMGTGGELRVLLRLRAEQFDLLCFLLCPSRKGKDAPTLWPDCTPLCPDSHETAWETETLSPCPLPPLERKKKKQKTKKCPDRAGFVHEPRVEPGLERIPLFWGCVMSRF